jgi:3-oxoadipate enol-lactonase
VRTAARDGVELWWEGVGEGTPVVLVPGRGDSADLYPARFVDPLVAAGHRAVRYDPRDTGLSGDGGDEYTLTDLADDVLAVLDASGGGAAHLIGLSMGGLILTELAVRAPERVLSLTFLSAASPDPDAGIGPDFFEMIGDDPVATFLGAMHAPTDEDRRWVEDEIATSGRRAPIRPEAGERHQSCAFRSVWPTKESLREIASPTLVIHGAEDLKLPVAHGRAFETGIPGARLVLIDDMGHIPRSDQWDDIAELVVGHLTDPSR